MLRTRSDTIDNLWMSVAVCRRAHRVERTVVALLPSGQGGRPEHRTRQGGTDRAHLSVSVDALLSTMVSVFALHGRSTATMAGPEATTWL